MTEVARLYRENFLQFNCPGCGCLHGVNVRGTRNHLDAGWDWNENLESPTLSPSILVRGTVPITDDEHARIMAGEKIEPKPLVCHSFVRNGQIEFLSDCTHELAGKTVPLEAYDKG